MIDWYTVGFSAMWILGLSFVTTGLSMANHKAHQENRRFRQALMSPSCRWVIGLGLIIFCLGLAGVVTTLWELILWIILALIFASQTWIARK